MKKLLTIILALCIAAPTMADTLTVVSDETVQIIEVINKDGLVSTPVDTSGDSLYAVRAYEPNQPAHDPDGYPFIYLDPLDDVNESLWDNRVSPTFDGTGADWIWETELSEDPNEYDEADPLYDPDASGNGRVVVFQKTFTIEESWSILSAGLAVAADNCYEVWLIDSDGEPNLVDISATAQYGDGWENVGMMKEDVVNYTGWQSEGIYNVASLLTYGENTIVIMAGNEFHGYVSPGSRDYQNDPIPGLSPDIELGEPGYYQYNPGGMIFALVVEYEEILTYDICGAKFEFVDPDIGSPLSGWTIDLYNDVPELIATAVTDVNGEYCFIDLSAGDYFVGEILQSGWTQIAPDDITDWGYYITLPGGETNWEDQEPLTYNFLNEQIEEPNGYCSFTQGFWGNAGGSKFGETTTEILTRLLDGDPLVVGLPGASITFVTPADVLNGLPAGGPAKALPSGDNPPSVLSKKNKPEINNVLVGQVVALTLNTRYDGYLGDLVLPGTIDEDGVFCVVYDGGCPMQYTISKEVIDLLGGAGATVYDLLDLANAALAGGYSKKELSAINSAVSTINEAFDECVDLIDCPTSEVGLCDNGCDDDFDGLTDCVPGYEDPDCNCLF